MIKDKIINFLAIVIFLLLSATFWTGIGFIVGYVINEMK